MKLKRLNPDSLPTQRGQGVAAKPRMAFETTGLIALNEKAAEQLSLKAGDGVEVVFDEEGGGIL